jgi:hypothetical protein|tara:strand:- start:78 stop:704 length:627 start_codon:yes stop_codon:yes gene_type:complete
MSATAFVLGNGESRKGIKIADMQKHGKVYACNGVYRTETPDYLIAVDPKMILEIGEGDYMTKHPVWSNFNAQYNKHDKILNHVQWFKPSLGWSSGPTALRMALDHGNTEVYMLGFDYQGHSVKDQGNRFKFNNIFKDSRNYKRSKDDATFYGNWMNQTKRCLSDFKQVKFYRVIPKDWFKPKDLDWNENLTHLTIDDFLEKFNLKVNN